MTMPSTRELVAPPTRFAEHDLVRLRFDTADGETIVKGGAIGTIVHRHAGGTAFEVEFAAPVPVVLTLETLDILPLADAA